MIFTEAPERSDEVIHLFRIRFTLSMLHHEKGLTKCQSLFVTVEVDRRTTQWFAPSALHFAIDFWRII